MSSGWFPHEQQKKTNKDSNNTYFEDMESKMMFISKPETASGMVPFAEFSSFIIKNKEEVVQDYHDSSREDATKVVVDDDSWWEQQLFLSLALTVSPETAIGAFHCGEVLDDDMKQQLVQKQQAAALPKTFTEAMDDPRAIVVTSMEEPFSIVDVNEAWVGLCGYTKEEAKNQQLGHLLQGPETNVDDARQMVSKVQTGQYSRAVLTNYTKDGRKFQNYIQLGILDEDGDAQYFVGVLQEVQKQQTMG